MYFCPYVHLYFSFSNNKNTLLVVTRIGFLQYIHVPHGISKPPGLFIRLCDCLSVIKY